MELNKCPNCSGRLELAPNRRRMVCPFCGGEFALEDADRKEDPNCPIYKDWFIYEWNYKLLRKEPKYKEFVQPFVRTLNEYDSSDAIEKYMRDYLMNFDELSAPGIREDKMQGVVNRLKGTLAPDERIILYHDDGIFVRGKTGVVLTNKRTFFVTKKAFKDVPHVSIPYLLFGYSIGMPEIKLGEQYDYNISTFTSHYELMGTVAALICTYSFEQRPDRPKIRLTSSVK
ncbi:MAG: transposase [Saccharofermentans sp.]|nr:transposase [Saccharofermentans sp.]